MLRRNRTSRAGRRTTTTTTLLPLLLATLAEAGEASLGASSRPYVVLKTQNLVLMGSVLGLLLIAMILMAVCVYKPVRRR